MSHFFACIVAIIAMSTLTSCNYNSLVEKKETATQQWAQVENVYQRRADLIPNLVETVKGYAAHESKTLEDVVAARAKASSLNINPENLDEAQLQKFQEAQGELSTALGKLMMITESYPDLKANQNFLSLQAQLEGTENRIATERKRYTEVVRDYNVSIKKFPTNIYAGWFGFEELPQFKAEAGAEKAPQVKF